MGHQSVRRMVERTGRHRFVRHHCRHVPHHIEQGDRQEGGERSRGVRAEAIDEVQVRAQAGERRGDRWTDDETRPKGEADAAGGFQRVHRDAERESVWLAAQESAACLLAAADDERRSSSCPVRPVPRADHRRRDYQRSRGNVDHEQPEPRLAERDQGTAAESSLLEAEREPSAGSSTALRV